MAKKPEQMRFFLLVFNSNPLLLNYILITFSMFSCGRESISLSANLIESSVVVMLLLRNNSYQMLRVVQGGILHAGRASTPGTVLDSTEIS